MDQAAEGYMADCCLTAGTEDWLSQFISRHIADAARRQKAITILTAPTIPSYTNEEEIALQRLARKIRGQWRTFPDFFRFLQRTPRFWKALKRHARLYYWVENNYYAKVLTERYFASKLFRLVRQPFMGDLATVLKKNRIEKNKLLHRLHNPWLSHVVYFSEQMTHMQDYRKMCLIRFSHFLRLIFSEMGKRVGLDLNEMYSVVEPEVAKVFLDRNFDPQELRSRRLRTFVYGTRRGYVLYHGRTVSRFVHEKDFEPRNSAADLIAGVAASPGIARGVVRLVRNAHQPGPFNKGDILVTNNTTPEFVPLMKKAAAIITDQGGITTHAAIVSRELGIPCVIGTMIATRVLKTGDRVEVDATKGIVKKI
ncbi:MAG: hypothetical protein HZC01_01350 [Candidatus Kerfeldbacteria bacterium]|nr:hypothetical protein [Candidatus Kerfeldbacteria bacterium]